MPRRLERDIAQLIQQREEMKRALGEWRRDLRQRAARIRLLSEAGAITAGPAAAEKARDSAWVDGAGPEMKHLPVQ
jgi:hypothetical protein